jgi:peptidyl-tRNA hydrolase
VNERLYVVVRSDLSSGDQLCQAVHAAVAWCMRYPGIAARWYDRSNYLVILSVPDEAELRARENLLDGNFGLRTMLVTEPDLADQATAFAVEHRAQKLLSSLPLAMKEPAMT